MPIKNHLVIVGVTALLTSLFWFISYRERYEAMEDELTMHRAQFEQRVEKLRNNDEFTVNVDGTAYLPFTGSYIVSMGNGWAESETIEGKVPTEFRFKGELVSMTLQKKETGGTLVLRIEKNGSMVKTATTHTPYGAVSVTAN